MCGICGYVGDHRPDLLEPMARAIAHRGPDDMGVWHDETQRVGFGHRRLSIIDLSPAGHQPMTNEDGTVWITYNGEIYNFPELRERLLSKGHVFRSHSDTEVLVHLYEEMGPDLVNELNGIFAFAIWDKNRRQLLLARDHAGVKPLYYWQDGQRMFFASEIKALLRVPGVPRELNRDAIPTYLTLLWVPGEETMLKAIRKVEPGHYLIWRDGRTEIKQWFHLAYEPDDSKSEQHWIEEVHDTFMRTCRRQMLSDVQLGAFLSGGADSSAIVACMRNSFPDREIRCYTYKVDRADMTRDQFELDYPHAERVASHLGVELLSIDMKPDCLSLLSRMVYAMDEPDADPAIYNSYMISKLARDDGTIVLLSGTGGDEVLFGYRSFQALRTLERLAWLPKSVIGPLLGLGAAAVSSIAGAQGAIPRRLRRFRRALISNDLERHLALSDWSHPSVRRRILKDASVAGSNGDCVIGGYIEKYFRGFEGRGELNRRAHVLIQTFLAAHNFLYTDKTSMACSVEVRVPYLDVELLRLCARIPERFKLRGNTTKFLLKEAMKRHLPRDILYRSKTGFGTPLRKWIAEDLAPQVRELLSPARIAQRGLFDPQIVQQVIAENESNKADHAYLIYALMVLEVWTMTFVDAPGQEQQLDLMPHR